MRQHDARTDDAVALPEWLQQNREGLPGKLFTLRQKLYRKAKREPGFRFYTLYGLIPRLDVLEAAWVQVARNGGAPGVDGVTIAAIETAPGGPTVLLLALRQELVAKTYRPQAVRRVSLPKADGQQRPLGIPTVRDRVVQTAAKLILEPIFEADFRDCSYGYRPGRRAHQALEAVAQSLREGYTAIYDADVQAYFDTIPHDQLLRCVERRVADRSVLRLLRLWLTAPVEERDQRNRPRRQRPTQGTPQGGVISPLLANIYLHWFDVVFHRRGGPGTWAQARLVRYADDFVILARQVEDRFTGWVDATVEGWLGLRMNRDKTRVLHLTPEGDAQLDFLGYTFRYAWDRYRRRRRYLTAVPSATAVARHREDLRQLISAQRCFVPLPRLIQQVNRVLQGWGQYFCYGHPRPARRALNAFVIVRLMRHLRRRSQRPYRPPVGMSAYTFLTKRMGLQLL